MGSMLRQEINTFTTDNKLELLDFILDNSVDALHYALQYYNHISVKEETIKLSPPNPNKCEGYWTKTRDNRYLPIISNEVWTEKSEWLQKAYVVNANTPTVSYRGIAFSRLDGSFVGNEEYQDTINNICWPEGYVEHYIRDNNVMPTERFYNYINARYDQLIKSP